MSVNYFEQFLWDRLLSAARQVLTWDWEDCDEEPKRDMKQLDAAVDDLDDWMRLKAIAHSPESPTSPLNAEAAKQKQVKP